MCLKFQLSAEAGLAQSVERKALNLVVVGSSPTVGVAAQLLLSQLRTQLCELTSTEHAPNENCGHSQGGAA